ncbi:uncharacterized protein LOC126840858 [Adelges cooleyi]|uniref:uncharacterized protein LOC126840858 n=1 Tax=Adelges cooleyi TaxID=133065 RepID=UPI00217F5EF1|nr:uncharacterized protein LOC126840858 [Adelges cooleyi]
MKCLLLVFSAMYVLSMCALWRCVAAKNHSDTMNELLSYRSWLAMAKPEENLVNIVDYTRDAKGIEVTIDTLIATPVTEKNQSDKIRLAHQFLSCSYARVLTDYCDHESAIGPQCRKVIMAAKSFDCLVDYLRVVESKQPMIARMIGALSSLHSLSPETPFQIGLYNILLTLQDYCQPKTIARPAENEKRKTWDIVDAECKNIEQHARDMADRSNGFYKMFCRPRSVWTRHENGDTNALLIGRELGDRADKKKADLEFLGCDRDTYAAHIIKNKLNLITQTFDRSYDNSGFKYESDSNTTSIIPYDEESRKVKKKKGFGCF